MKKVKIQPIEWKGASLIVLWLRLHAPNAKDPASSSLTLAIFFVYLFIFFLNIAILVARKWYLIMFLIYISLMINDIEHLFCISSLE